MTTQGISPKAVLAAVVPALGGLVAVGVQWIATGALDRAELATAVGAVLASLLAFAGAYAGKPGDVKAEIGLTFLEVVVVLLIAAVILLALGVVP